MMISIFHIIPVRYLSNYKEGKTSYIVNPDAAFSFKLERLVCFLSNEKFKQELIVCQSVSILFVEASASML
mgnify:FL=1